MCQNTKVPLRKKYSKLVRAVAFLLIASILLGVGYTTWHILRRQALLKAIEQNEERCDEAFLSLIDKLVQVEEGDIGYMPTVYGHKFLPSDDKGQINSLILGGPPPQKSSAMLEIVRAGADAVPCLIAHLDDERQTKMVLSHSSFFGGMFFGNEYSYNRETTRPAVAGLNDDEGWEYLTGSFDAGQTYTVTVGDLCFVALGQIVNRDFSAVRYQPTAIIVINSPAHSPKLLQATRYEWGTLTPETHKASLILDIHRPDYPERREGAIERLLFYYPDVAEQINIE